MNDKAKLGTRFTCFTCGTKFYDLHREVALCPECGADQAEAPVRDIKSLLSGRGRPRPTTDSDSVPTSVDTDSSEDDEFDDIDVDDDDSNDDDDDDDGGGSFDDED